MQCLVDQGRLGVSRVAPLLPLEAASADPDRTAAGLRDGEDPELGTARLLPAVGEEDPVAQEARRVPADGVEPLLEGAARGVLEVGEDALAGRALQPSHRPRQRTAECLALAFPREVGAQRRRLLRSRRHRPGRACGQAPEHGAEPQPSQITHERLLSLESLGQALAPSLDQDRCVPWGDIGKVAGFSWGGPTIVLLTDLALGAMFRRGGPPRCVSGSTSSCSTAERGSSSAANTCAICRRRLSTCSSSC